MAETPYIHINYSPSMPPTQTSKGLSLSLSASPKSDIYASPGPPQVYTYTAPIFCRRIKKSSFALARVAVNARWNLQFDQGGLVFTIPTLNNPHPDAQNANVFRSHPSWVKVGIEANDGAPCVSVVGKSRTGWCDWSLVPLESKIGEEVSAMLELTRFKNALMVWSLRNETRVLIRKIPWVFLDDPHLSEDILVGLYAARPDPDDRSGGQSLQTDFVDFVLGETGEEISNERIRSSNRDTY